MLIEGIMNLCHWDTDFGKGIFTLEITDVNSKQKIIIKVDRQAFTEIIIGNRSEFKKNCSVLLSEKLGKKKEVKTVRIKGEGTEINIKKYLIKNGIEKEGRTGFVSNRQGGTKYDGNGNIETEVILYRYI